MQSLSQKTILRYWVPLTLSCLMMAAEGPFLTALVARGEDPKYNLAAFGVAFSIALIIESPVISILSATAALMNGRATHQVLWRSICALNILTTLGMIIIIIPAVFDLVIGTFFNLDPKVAELTYMALPLMLLWPAPIGYRRFYQGLLIRYGQTKLVSYGSAIRVAAMMGGGYLIHRYSGLPAACVGTGGLICGVTAEALASRIMANSIIKDLRAGKLEQPNAVAVTYPEFARFYWPLTLMILVSFSVRPIVTFAMGYAPLPVESLAVLPVIAGLIFMLQSGGYGLQEAALVLVGDKLEHRAQLWRFTKIIGVIATSILALITFTPLSTLWFSKISGLEGDLLALALAAVPISMFVPLISTWGSWQRAQLLKLRRTKEISNATLIEIASNSLMLLLFVGFFDLIGIYAALIAGFIGVSAGNLYLWWRLRSVSNFNGGSHFSA